MEQGPIPPPHARREQADRLAPLPPPQPLVPPPLFAQQRFQYARGVAPFNRAEENDFWLQIQGRVNAMRQGQQPNPGLIRGQFNLAGRLYQVEWVVGGNLVTVIRRVP